MLIFLYYKLINRLHDTFKKGTYCFIQISYFNMYQERFAIKIEIYKQTYSTFTYI